MKRDTFVSGELVPLQGAAARAVRMSSRTKQSRNLPAQLLILLFRTRYYRRLSESVRDRPCQSRALHSNADRKQHFSDTKRVHDSNDEAAGT
jgi:hypothetical protein